MAPYNQGRRTTEWNTDDLLYNPATATSTAATADANLATKPAQVQANSRAAGTTGPGGQNQPASVAGEGSYLGGAGINSGNRYGYNEFGGMMASADSPTFFDMYAGKQWGHDPLGTTSTFLGQTFDPLNVAYAMGGGQRPDQRLAQGEAFMNFVNQPGMQTFDPGTIVTSALKQFMNGKADGLAGLLIGQNASQQMTTIMSFLRQALTGTLSQDGLEAYLNHIQQQMMGILREYGRAGTDLSAMDKNGGIAGRLLQSLGPRGGL
jgi:hypothetical protein